MAIDNRAANQFDQVPRGAGERLFNVVNVLFMLLLVAVMVVPFINVLAVAFSSSLSSLELGIKLWPSEWSVEGFRTVWVNVGLQRAFINSVIVTSIGTVLHVMLAAFAGYVLIQRNLPGKKLMIGLILATMAIPGELIMIPLFIVNQTLGLLNSLAALVFSGLVSGFSILLIRNYFQSVPYDLWESAKIDGAGDFFIFRTIYLPLSQAGLATIALFELVSRWNQFLPVILYISDSSKYTLQVTLQALVTESIGTSGTSMITPNVRMAGIVIAILPLVVLYPFMQKYFVQGITLGSVKE
ncbi:MAG: carbohydrate ABC transporter permease [Chloroflexia bacterium]|jgi:putative aldouronate transport system permease protein|nr:carbohydrate ABC transporter permease [Chloroflexia bacterium]